MQIDARFISYTGTDEYLCVSDDLNIGKVYCTGRGEKFIKNTCLSLHGEFSDKVFKVSEVYIDFNETRLSRFLVDCKFKNVGIVKARKIAKLFNDGGIPDTFDGIEPVVYSQIKNILSTFRMKNRFMEHLPEIMPNTVNFLIEHFGDSSFDRVMSDPYKYAGKAGTPLAVCDRIAKSNGILSGSDSRYELLLHKSLHYIKMAGNTCVDPENLVKTAEWISRSSGVDAPFNREYLLVMAVSSGIFNTTRKHEKPVFAVPELYSIEQKIASSVIGLSQTTGDAIKVDSSITKGCDRGQKRALNGCLVKSGFCIITGGPGTGKTTVIQRIVKAHETAGRSVVLCAPTGRAAARITESSGYSATTVHKLLGIKLRGEDAGTPDFDENNKLPYDVVIVDESSMIGTEIFGMLLNAMESGQLLILVGDRNQLESVDPGNILEDVINSGLASVFELTEIHRQESGSLIIDNSRKILKGDVKLSENDSFRIIRYEDAGKMAEEMLDIVRSEYKKDDPFYLQILTPLRKTDSGVRELNNKILSEVMGHNSRNYYPGDKVMTLRNSYQTGRMYMNGDIWLVEDMKDGNVTLRTATEPVSYTEVKDRNDLEHAYVSTIHKSQGSEFSHVLIIIPDGCAGMLNRNLLYTAVTRAREKVTILYMNDTLKQCITNKKKSKRSTMLGDLLMPFK